MAKNIFIEPAWKLPLSYSYMIDFPPDGYQFVVAQHFEENLSQALSRWRLFYGLEIAASKVIPSILIKSWLQKFRKPPAGTALTYAHGHLVFRPEPWVVEVEYASLLLGSNPKLLNGFHGLIERMLASPHCRKVRCVSEASRRTLLSGLDCEQFQHKVELVYLAVPAAKGFVKGLRGGKIRLLFVGSPNIKGHFEQKGGREVLETFALLRQRYHNLELVIKSDMPADVKARYEGMEDLRIMDKPLPWEALEHEYQSADIFILPCHGAAAFSIMDAMSYELPVVSINAWTNGEYIQDGKNGLLVEPSQKVPYYYYTWHPNFGSAEFGRAIQKPDPEVVGELVKKLSLLIENAELRRRLGQAGRREVESGKFSIKARNDKLKRMFDEAIAGVNAGEAQRVA